MSVKNKVIGATLVVLFTLVAGCQDPNSNLPEMEPAVPTSVSPSEQPTETAVPSPEAEASPSPDVLGAEKNATQKLKNKEAKKKVEKPAKKKIKQKAENIPAKKAPAKAKKPKHVITQSSKPSVKYTTVALNLRKSPEGKIINTLRAGAKVSLSGKQSGRWVEVTNSGWVSSNFLATKPPVKKAPAKVATPAPAKKKGESNNARCQRLAGSAARSLSFPQPPIDCGVVFDRSKMAYVAKANATYGVKGSGSIRVGREYMNRATDQQVLATLVHEVAHIKYMTASDEKREAHAQVLGTTFANMNVGPYKNRPVERFAQSVVVCKGLGGWMGYKAYSCDTMNKAMSALN